MGAETGGCLELAGCQAIRRVVGQRHRFELRFIEKSCFLWPQHVFAHTCTQTHVANPPHTHTHNWSDRKFQEMNAWRRQGSLSFRTQVLMCCPNCIVFMLWSRDSLSRAAKHYVPSRFVVPNSQGAVLYREICHTAEEVQVKPHYFTKSSFYEVCAGPLITTAFLHVGRSGVAKGLPSS